MIEFLLAIQRRNLTRLDGNNDPYAEQCRVAIRSVIAWLESNESMPVLVEATARSACRFAEEKARSGAAFAMARAAESATWSAESALALDVTRSAYCAGESAAWWAMRSGKRMSQSAWGKAWDAGRIAEKLQQRDDLLAMTSIDRTVNSVTHSRP